MPTLWTAQRDDPLQFERQESFAGCVDEFRRNTLLPADTLARAENVLIDTDHVARTRRGTQALGAAAVAAAAVQGLAYYDTPTTERLICAINQGVQAWNGTAWSALTGYTSSSASVDVEMAQGVSVLYLTDGSTGWYAYDGNTLTAQGTSERDPPRKATILAWHTSRMFAAGDPDKPDTLWASDILNAGPGCWQEAFCLRVGGGEGDAITALVPLQDYWLLVAKEQSLWLVNADPSAATAAAWTVTRVSGGHGVVGKRAWCYLGNDVLALTQEGIVGVRRMAADAQNYEVGLPVSEPMQPIIDRINWAYAGTSCAMRYHQFAFFAVPLDDATHPDTVLVYNGRLKQWVGYWTGWAPRQFCVSRFSADQRLTFGDGDGYVHQWLDRDEESTTLYSDLYNVSGAAAPVETLIRTRGFQFGEPVSNKDPEFWEVRFEDSDAAPTIAFVADGQTVKSWQGSVAEIVNQLPVDLPFDLADPRPKTVRQSLVGVSPFNEAYLEISASAGHLNVRNLTLAAFVNTLEGDET